MGELLCDRGAEFGTTTGRKRRCGWFDAVIGRYAVRINGLDCLAITKLDVLDELEEINVCIAYEVDGDRCYDFPVIPASSPAASRFIKRFPAGSNQLPIAVL